MAPLALRHDQAFHQKHPKNKANSPIMKAVTASIYQGLSIKCDRFNERRRDIPCESDRETESGPVMALVPLSAISDLVSKIRVL